MEEVRSIRFNQEQEEELLQRHLSVQSMESKSSMDLHEMTSQQDLITALVHREKVPFPSPIRSVLTPPLYPAQPSLVSEELVQVCLFLGPRPRHLAPAVTANWPVWLGSTFPSLRSPGIHQIPISEPLLILVPSTLPFLREA